MSTVNLYDVLNVPPNCKKSDIKKSYRILVKEFHPDQPTGNPEMFELIVHAYNILVNDKSRQTYDEYYQISQQSEMDHIKLKEKSDQFVKTQKISRIEKSEKDIENELKALQITFDNKHKYNRLDIDKISKQDADKRLNDIKLIREQEDIENVTEKLFDDDKIPLEKFNAVWDKIHKGSTDLIRHTGLPDPWNDMDETSKYGNIENYENLYVEDENMGTNEYSNVNYNVRSEDINNISGTNYTKQSLDPNYTKSLETLIKNREEETKILLDKEFNEFNTDQSCGGYGIFNKIGNISDKSSLNWDNSEDLHKKYKLLLETRKK